VPVSTVVVIATGGLHHMDLHDGDIDDRACLTLRHAKHVPSGTILTL